MILRTEAPVYTYSLEYVGGGGIWRWCHLSLTKSRAKRSCCNGKIREKREGPVKLVVHERDSRRTWEKA
jgi:hypothetical protein